MQDDSGRKPTEASQQPPTASEPGPFVADDGATLPPLRGVDLASGEDMTKVVEVLVADPDRAERLAVLGDGLAVWRVHHDLIREQDKNARVMTPAIFDRLAKNIARERRLESLPFARIWVNPAGNAEFLIISGHHRVRAARKAGLVKIPLLVHEGDMTFAEMRAKQLSHNALAGQDNPQVLAELYKEIEDVEARLATGLAADLEVPVDSEALKVDELGVDLGFEQVEILFLPAEFLRFEQALASLASDCHVYATAYEQWDRFKALGRKSSKAFDVRNIGAIMARLLDVVEDHYRPGDKVKPGTEEGFISAKALFGSDAIPVDTANALTTALEKVYDQKKGESRLAATMRALQRVAEQSAKYKPKDKKGEDD